MEVHSAGKRKRSKGELGKSDDEIAVYDEVVKRFGDASKPALKEIVKQAQEILLAHNSEKSPPAKETQTIRAKSKKKKP